MAISDIFSSLQFPVYLLRIYWALQRNLDDFCGYRNIIFATGFFGLFMSLAMSVLISIDRHLAIALKHRYRATVTKKRVFGTVISTYLLIIVVSIALASDLIFPYYKYITAVIGGLFLLTICTLYSKSLVALHRLSTRIYAQGHGSSLSNFDVTKYKKSLNTMIMVLMFLLVCVIPLASSACLDAIREPTKLSVVFQLSAFVIFNLNSCLNPIIYAIRFTDIRNACKECLRALICE